jgi:predicted MFS family arabinose efflux permease
LTALVRLHAVSTAADACIALALAGSLFFNTSLEVARPRLALYLALTLVPVAIMTPLIGPTVARYGAGSRLLVRIQRARVACALVLAFAAGSLLLYPLSLAVLVLGRVYMVVKRSLVPVVERPDGLIAANARLSRVGAYAGLAGAAIGGAMLHSGNQTALLVVAATLHAVATVLASRVPVPAVIAVPRDADRRRDPRVPASAVRPLAAMSALRFACGFVVVTLALALERAGEPAATLAGVLFAVSIGGYVGSFVSPRVRAFVANEHAIIAGSIFGGALATAAATVLDNLAATIVAVFLLSLGASVARHACDSALQQATTHATRSRAFAWYEAALQLAWAVGALVATLTVVAIAPGFLAATGVLALGNSVVRMRPYPARTAARRRVERSAELEPEAAPAGAAA